MTAVQIAKESSHINNEELREITQMMFDSFTIDNEVQSCAKLAKKEKLLDSFSTFIQEFLTLNVSTSKDTQLRLIKFIAKLKLQKELLELANGETNLEDIQQAGKRLGKKSQSAFEIK